mmetsp:Transcript_17360/g.23855  ORF Transcript_17360/g.23855 Transcript_17360/m.23855 type:complete len:239 (+) Transcript_17360:31-747(+)
MLQENIRGFFDSIFCPCVTNDTSLSDDGNFVSCYKPVRVGNSILLCGKRKSAFPFQFMVGPDWPMVALVYILIVVVDIVVLSVIAPIGWPPVLIGIVGAICLLIAYSMVACSDPGIVYSNDIQSDDTDLEESKKTSPQGESTRNARLMQRIPDTVECGHCQFKRPYSARHCHYCKVCIDDLDHHCPWCGKCIGKKNLRYFHTFLHVLCFQFYYLLGALIYFLVATYSSAKLPRGPGFQ